MFLGLTNADGETVTVTMVYLSCSMETYVDRLLIYQILFIMPMRSSSTGRRHTPVFPFQGFLGEWCRIQTASKVVKPLYGKLGC